jgi:hypothetical protein
MEESGILGIKRMVNGGRAVREVSDSCAIVKVG